MAYLQHRPAARGCRNARFGLSSRSICLLTGLAAFLFAGCGEPGSPQPPSLNLPVPVRNLSAQRTGDTVHLAWSTTDKTMDHTRPAGIITTRICRMQGTSSGAVCEQVVDKRLRLGVQATYDDILPADTTSGSPTLLTYYVELLNHAQKSGGRSNPAYSAGGADVPALTGLSTSLRSEGVLLHWNAAANPCEHCKVQIDRLLQSSGNAKPAPHAGATKAGSGHMASTFAIAPPSPRQTLEVTEHATAEALDRTAAFGQAYEYRAHRSEEVTLDGHRIDLLGQQSAPVTLETKDTFPPAIPADLAAAADSGSNAIDLSWTADSEPDLAGYIVYRHVVSTAGVTNSLLQRISGPTPLPAPAFHDPQVKSGVTYAYSVSALDQSGNESGRSIEAQESLASPQ